MPASSVFWLSWQGCICDLCHPFSGIGGKSGTTLPFSPVHHSRPLRNLQSQGPCDSWEGIFGAGAHQNTATGFLWKQHEYFSVWILLVVVRVARLQHTQWLLSCLYLSSSSTLELQQWCSVLRPAERLFWSRFYGLIWIPAVRGSKPAGAAEATSPGCPRIQLHASPRYTVKHLDWQRGFVHSHFLSTEVFWDTFLPLSSPQKVAGIFCGCEGQRDWLLLE